MVESAQRHTVRSFCRICTTICGIEVDVDGDEVVRVRGDRNHPFTHGYTCPKGRALPQLHHHQDRLERPMHRLGGTLREGAWDAVLDDIGARLRAIIDGSGPSAVGVFFGSGIGMDAAGYRMQEALLRAIGTPARFSPLTIDGTAKTLIAHLVGGFPGFTSHVDYGRARMVVYIGVNPVVSHGHNIGLADPLASIRALARRAEVWVLDPRRSETARLATRHLAPRPGTDSAFSRSSFARCCATESTTRSGVAPSATRHWLPPSSRTPSSVRPKSPASPKTTSSSCWPRCVVPVPSLSMPGPG